MSVKTRTGNTEAKHIASVKASDVYKSKRFLIPSLIAISVIVVCSLVASAMNTTNSTPIAMVESITPTETIEPTAHHNDDKSDHGSVINGDNNTVTLDNRVMVIHHHETERVVEKPVVEYRTVTVEKPVIQTVYRQVAASPVDDVPVHCDDSMAEHHERVAGWYRMIAANKRR